MEGGDPPTHDAGGLLRELPSVHELAARLDAPHRPAVAAARGAIEEARERLRAGGVPDADLLAASKLRGSLPEPRMNYIPEIDRIIKILSRATAVKEKMCEWMRREVFDPSCHR